MNKGKVHINEWAKEIYKQWMNKGKVQANERQVQTNEQTKMDKEWV